MHFLLYIILYITSSFFSTCNKKKFFFFFLGGNLNRLMVHQLFLMGKFYATDEQIELRAQSGNTLNSFVKVLLYIYIHIYIVGPQLSNIMHSPKKINSDLFEVKQYFA